MELQGVCKRWALSAVSWELSVMQWSVLSRLWQLHARQVPALWPLCPVMSTGIPCHGDSVWGVSRAVQYVRCRWIMYVMHVAESVERFPVSCVLWWRCGRADVGLLRLWWCERYFSSFVTRFRYFLLCNLSITLVMLLIYLSAGLLYILLHVVISAVHLSIYLFLFYSFDLWWIKDVHWLYPDRDPGFFWLPCISWKALYFAVILYFFTSQRLMSKFALQTPAKMYHMLSLGWTCKICSDM